MGKLSLTVASKADDLLYVHAVAETPAFAAKTSFYCKSVGLVEGGKKIKAFSKAGRERIEFTLGEAKRKTDFSFRVIGSTGLCELWLRIRGIEDEQGQSAEAYFPIDYLEPASIDAFALELIKMGTGHVKTAEIKNKFESQ